jgi:hypothetical protein
MRVARFLTLVLLSVPTALRGQDHGEQFKDSISWGTNKETFKVALTVRRRYEGAFTVSAQGFRWVVLGAADTGTGPIPWEDLSGWSCGPYVLTMTTPLSYAQIGLKHEELLKVVDQYLRKYALAALDQAKGCSPDRT